MTDDPRDILRAAGVEWPDDMPSWSDGDTDATIVWLARLVAKYKAECDYWKAADSGLDARTASDS